MYFYLLNYLASQVFLAGMPLQHDPITAFPVKARPQHRELCALPFTNRCGFFNVPQLFYVKGCETGPLAYSPYSRILESLTICWCNYKGSTFYSVILRPWVLVRPESNSRPPAWQPDPQPTEASVRGQWKWVSTHFKNRQSMTTCA